jgi:hypothetical protein
VDERMFTFGAYVPVQSVHSYGWLKQIDPITLYPIKSSPKFKSGGHNWCGGAAIIADDSIVFGNGRYVNGCLLECCMSTCYLDIQTNLKFYNNE